MAGFNPRNDSEAIKSLKHGQSDFAWRLSHQLEGRDPDTARDGVWQISHFRCERMYGQLHRGQFPIDLTLADATNEHWQNARKRRLLCYFRVADRDTAIRVLRLGKAIRFAAEVNQDWYDPPEGEIPAYDGTSPFQASHAVEIHSYEQGRFHFSNSWGADWGAGGYGSFPATNWEPTIVGAWVLGPNYAKIPSSPNETGLMQRGWKWGISEEIAVHCREIYDADTDEHIAWAYCVPRNNRLELDEFFVHPKHRRNGFGVALAQMVTRLAEEMKLPLRLIVSFADSQEANAAGAMAVASLFHLALTPSPARWAARVSRSVIDPENPPRYWQPSRPATILERIRKLTKTPETTAREVSVYWATNRQPLDSDIAQSGFSDLRAGDVRYGRALVQIPKMTNFGSGGRGIHKLWPFGKGTSCEIKGLNELAAERFFEMARECLSNADWTSQSLLYVHGFKNSFEESVLRAAQLGLDLKIAGPTFLFGWASSNRIRGYTIDEATAAWSIPHLEGLILRICEQHDAPLSILAHSMGSRIVLGALSNLVKAGTALRISQLIFAAPDVDAEIFRAKIPEVADAVSRVTLYTSSGDIAIRVSELLHGYPRAGLAPPLTVVPGVDTIHVENFDLFSLGHGYLTDATNVLHDIFALLRYDNSPDDRAGTVPHDGDEGQRFWRLKLS